MPTPDALAARVSSRQHSCLTHEQALACGLTQHMIDTRLRLGRWEVLHRGVYRIAGAPLSWLSRATAASLACGGPVSHASAAHLWDLEGFASPGIVDVTVERHQRGQRRRGVRIHESKVFELRGEVRRRGVPCTGVARTILDVCAVVESDLDALCALDCALRRHIVTWDELWRCLVLHAARGRNGVARYRRILLRRHGKRVPDRKIAAMTLELIVDAGLPEPESEVWTLGKRYRIDLAYPHLKIAIECIGKEGHLNDASFEYDPVRRNELQLAGWIVIEVTWRRLIEKPDRVIAEVREAIAIRTGVR